MCSIFFSASTVRAVVGYLLFLVIVSPVQAQFNYTTTDGAITITGYSGPGGVVGIPSAINGVPVVAIGAQSFFNQSSLTGLIVSNGVASIGSYAFNSCANLVSVSLPNTLTNIGDKAFASCTSLTNITIPGNVTNLGDVPFYLCSALAAINVNSTNPAYSSVAGVLFDKNLTKLLEAPGIIAGTYAVPGSVTDIGDNAFWECTGLTGFTIPNGVVVIEGGALGYCGGLTNLNIPATVTNLGVWAFYGCSNLTTITVASANPAFTSTNGVLFDSNLSTLIQFPAGATNNFYAIPASVTSLAQSAFSYCANLTSVTIPTNVTDIGYAAFEYCSRLGSVVVPDTVTNLGDLAFSYCSDLTQATVGSGVTSLGLEAFGYCTSLANITLGNSITNIGAEAFYECQSLISLTLPTNVISIGFESFSVCNNLQNLTLPNSLVNIGDDAFQLCGLTSLTIPAGVTNIGSSVFQSCSSLTAINVAANNPGYSSVAGVLFNRNHTTLIRYPAAIPASTYIIPNGVTSIADGAFTQSYNLTSVIFPDTLVSLGQFAFAACDGLTSITLPASVANLDSYAFSACYNLNSVYCFGNAPAVDSQSFYSDSATIYYLPGTAGWGSTLAGQITTLWSLPYPVILTSTPNFGVHSNTFGFEISWATALPVTVTVEACTNLAQPVWLPVTTFLLPLGSVFFSDPNGATGPARYYRLTAL